MGTFTPKVFKHLDYNKGIPLDIFPFDYCDPQKMLKDREKIFERIQRCASYMKLKNPELPAELKEKCYLHKTENPLRDWEEIQRIAANPAYDNSEYMMMAVVIPDYNKPHVYKTEWFESAIMHKFETIEVPIPIGWKEILTEGYGEDFMQYPPENERGAINDHLIVNPYIPYKEYFKA